MMSRSVAQIATASIRTRTSAGRGTGTGLSTSESRPGSPSTQAFMLEGMGNLGSVLTLAGMAMAISLSVTTSCPIMSPEMSAPQAIGAANGGGTKPLAAAKQYRYGCTGGG